MLDSIILCLGGDHAWVPEEEVWRAAHSHLSLRALPLLVCCYQNLSKSQWRQMSALSQVTSSISTSYRYLTLLMCFLHPGRHVLWCHFYQPGSWAEYLHCCYCAFSDYSVVHRHRFVCPGCIHFPVHRKLWIALKTRSLILKRTITAGKVFICSPWIVYLWCVVVLNYPWVPISRKWPSAAVVMHPYLNFSFKQTHNINWIHVKIIWVYLFPPKYYIMLSKSCFWYWSLVSQVGWLLWSTRTPCRQSSWLLDHSSLWALVIWHFPLWSLHVFRWVSVLYHQIYARSKGPETLTGHRTEILKDKKIDCLIL